MLPASNVPRNKNFGQRKVSNKREANFGDLSQKTGTADYAAGLGDRQWGAHWAWEYARG